MLQGFVGRTTQTAEILPLLHHTQCRHSQEAVDNHRSRPRAEEVSSMKHSSVDRKRRTHLIPARRQGTVDCCTKIAAICAIYTIRVGVCAVRRAIDDDTPTLRISCTERRRDGVGAGGVARAVDAG